MLGPIVVLVDDEPHAPSTITRSPRHRGKERPAMSRRVLFVDDEPNTLLALRRELRDWSKAAGVEIDIATDPLAVMGMLNAHPGEYELVVSDLRMPAMKGSDLLVSIKQRYPEILSILLSGYSEVEEVMKAIKAGIFSYILKPWDRDYLRAEIEKALEVYRIRKENADNQRRLDMELRWAGEMQRFFLTIKIPAPQGLRIDLDYRPLPSLYCGGDYYDILELPQRGTLLLVGDVAGHGVTGALVTGILKSIIVMEYIGPQGVQGSMAGLMKWLNRRLAGFFGAGSSMFISLFAGLFDPGARSLRYANAGQVPPLHFARGKATPLASTGPALGFMPDADYREEEEHFQTGDMLLLFTDGLVEMGAGTVSDGTRRVVEVMQGPDGAGLSAAAIGSRTLAVSGSAAFTDDVTIIRVDCT